jgi:chromate transporter
VGLLLPSTVLMLLVGAVYWRFKDAPWLVGAMRLVKPVVIGLLVYIVVDLFPSAGIGGEAGWGKPAWISLTVAAVAFVLLSFSVHPALVMIGAMGLGALFLPG